MNRQTAFPLSAKPPVYNSEVALIDVAKKGRQRSHDSILIVDRLSQVNLCFKHAWFTIHYNSKVNLDFKGEFDIFHA